MSCPTPLPTPDPATLAAGESLVVDRLGIPIDHDGHFEIVVGEARLPNGRLTIADFSFGRDDWP